MNINHFLNIVEMRTKIVSVSGLLIGCLAAVFVGHSFNWPLAILLWVSALAIDMGTTAFNSFYDYYHQVDNQNFNQEIDKVLVHKKVAPGLALLIALALFAIGGACGLVLAVFVGWELVLAGAICMAVGFLYNGGPLPISRTPLGELFAGGCLGFVLPIIAYYVFCHRIDQSIILLSLPSLFMVASILTVNNNCDWQGDKAAGRLTLSIALGPKVGRWLVPGFGLIAWGFVAWNFYGIGFGLIAAIPLLLGFLVSIPLYWQLDRRAYSHATKGPNMGSISQIFMVYTLAVCLWLVISHL